MRTILTALVLLGGCESIAVVRDVEIGADDGPPVSASGEALDCEELDVYVGDLNLDERSEQLAFFENYDRIQGTLRVEWLRGDVAQCLRFVSDDLWMSDLTTATVDIASLRGVDRIGLGGEEIAHVHAPRLETVHDLYLGHIRTTSVGGFQSMHTITGDLSVHQCRELTSLDELLPNLESVEGQIYMGDNPQLTQAEIDRFLSRIPSLPDEIILEDNAD